MTTRIPESVVNLEVAFKLQSLLEARGVKVVMVRMSEDVDISSSRRAEIANGAKADLFLRLHCDGSESSSDHGVQTLVPGPDRWTAPIVARSGEAGHIIQEAVVRTTGAPNLGVTRRTDLAGFNWSKVPSVLVEMGFLSNPDEEHKLDSPSYQQKLADGLADGAMKYWQRIQ